MNIHTLNALRRRAEQWLDQAWARPAKKLAPTAKAPPFQGDPRFALVCVNYSTTHYLKLMLLICDPDVIFLNPDTLQALADTLQQENAALAGELRRNLCPQPEAQASFLALRRDIYACRDVSPFVNHGVPAWPHVEGNPEITQRDDHSAHHWSGLPR